MKTRIEIEKVKCTLCKKPVENGKFWAVLRGYSNLALEDKTLDLDDHSYGDNFNIKSETIICFKCIEEGKHNTITFR